MHRPVLIQYVGKIHLNNDTILGTHLANLSQFNFLLYFYKLNPRIYNSSWYLFSFHKLRHIIHIFVCNWKIFLHSVIQMIIQNQQFSIKMGNTNDRLIGIHNFRNMKYVKKNFICRIIFSEYKQKYKQKGYFLNVFKH